MSLNHRFVQNNSNAQQAYTPVARRVSFGMFHEREPVSRLHPVASPKAEALEKAVSAQAGAASNPISSIPGKIKSYFKKKSAKRFNRWYRMLHYSKVLARAKADRVQFRIISFCESLLQGRKAHSPAPQNHGGAHLVAFEKREHEKSQPAEYKPKAEKYKAAA
jgi:hypothetical protein